MSLDLDAVIEAVAIERYGRLVTGTTMLTGIVTAAAPLIEAQVRAQIVADINALILPGAVTRDYKIGNAALTTAARVAGGES